MSQMSEQRPRIADQVQRDAAVGERARNVLIDAGAGTGKTRIIVERLVNMVAPAQGGPGISIDRIAAVTFTRRAAGELRLRIREALLRGLADPAVSSSRAQRLRDAFAGIDTAHIGTIHSFADRLLRLRPVAARLSPSYDVVDEDDDLVHETFARLLHAVETAKLGEELAGTDAVGFAEEAAQTLTDVLRAGLRAESRETEYWTYHGLNSLVAEFVRRRDVPPSLPLPPRFDLLTFRRYATEFVDLVAPLDDRTRGTRLLHALARVIDRLRSEEDPVVIHRELAEWARPLKNLKKGEDFDSDVAGWGALKAIRDGSADRQTPLLDDLLSPTQRWFAHRLCRLFLVVVAVYERVKAQQKVVDQVDLLLKLRDLLVRDCDARRYYQSLFDHVFVDEFQDTDPLQAEIILFLCEQGARAEEFSQVVLADGKLTVVGDPKQSIYRFRRADVAMSDQVRRLIQRRDHLAVELSVNFRSRRGLIDWFDRCFDDLLGRPPTSGMLFNVETGEVFHQPLHAKRDDTAPAHVHVLPFEVAGEQRAEPYRRLEAEALAHYLHWLVEVRKFPVEDPVTHEARGVRYADVAILAVATTALDPLFPALDTMGIPHSARGGVLFLEDPLHRQFLLGLRAIADAGDGVAHAALLRPPFFAVDLAEIVRSRGADGDGGGRLRGALDLVQQLRRDRFNRSPGGTARDLLEKTAFARSVALGPNGAQRLWRLRELCLVLEQLAAAEGINYDAATVRLREWVTDPVQLDQPPPVGSEAVQVMTVHQAKGLEFPVVVLWDGRALLAAPSHPTPWAVDRQRRGWSLALDGLEWQEPPQLNLAQTEKSYANAERKRVIYVAATRARDLLVIPKAGQPPAHLICGRLVKNCDPSRVENLETYVEGRGASWSAALPRPAQTEPSDVDELERRVTTEWAAAAIEAGRSRFAPASVTGEALAAPADDDDSLPPPGKRKGRFGTAFGETVHRAIGTVVRDLSVTGNDAVARAARHTGLTDHLTEAAADVERTIAALKREGLLQPASAEVYLEYPVAAAMTEGGKLVVGYIDLVVNRPASLDVIDFKTDEPPAAETMVPLAYAAQVTSYAHMVESVRADRKVRVGLLFTADGQVRWIR
ncbi:MAG: UvrD-helicase domain-containing protein [Bauldia sp.]